MGAEGRDRRVIGDQPALGERRQDPVAHLPLGYLPPGGAGPRKALPGIGDDAVERLCGAVVGGELGAAQAAQRPLHQILRGLQGEAGPFQQSRGAVIQGGKARQGRRALRGQDAAGGSHAGEQLGEAGARGVAVGGPVDVVQGAGLDLVDELQHLAVGADERQPGPRVGGVGADPEHRVGDLIAVVDVVEQPARAAGSAHRGARLLEPSPAGHSSSEVRFAHASPTSVASISALAVCLRFSACSQTIE